MRTNGPVLATVVFAVLGAIAMASPATAQTDALHVTPGGDVGIGTTSPDAGLEVVRTNGDFAELAKLTNDGTPRLVFNDTTATAHWVLQPTTIGTGSHFQITRKGTGGFELQVDTNGDLRARGDIFSGGQKLTVPDYVFAPDYDLRSMSELRAFIFEHKHLPNVPSGKELKSSGLNHSEFQMRLLEKIEELTLYTLAQEETIAGLEATEAENAGLRDRLARVERVLGIAGQ